MGDVYRAKDSRLGREVAIKLLPDAFSKDPARVARFEREARLLASINHPAIGAIYGAETAGDMRYLVLELVPGETLKDRLSHPLPLKEALTICRQIAEGLEAAHEKGIVHRDLKPANVIVTPQGKVKILDLGLAKAMEVQSSPDDLSQASTAVIEETLPGVILGTVGYMSPEQARGKPIDKRTDIWAFGCILFECLTGHRTFSGGNISDVIASILRSEPEWPELPADTPPEIRDLLGRCLEKDPSQRLRDIGDARIAIDNHLASTGGATRLWTAPTPKRSRKNVWFFTAAVTAALAAAGWWYGLKTLPIGANRTAKTLAVLPFKDLSGTPGGQLLGDGLAETVSVRLAKFSGIQVVAPATAVTVSDRERDPYRVASNLGAAYLVRGSIQRSGARVRITYSVWNAHDRVQVAGDALDGADSDLFGIQDRLAESVGNSLKLKHGAVSANVPSGLDSASEQDRYLRALGYLQRYDRPGSVDQAIKLLEELASEKPSSSSVQAALGGAYLHKFDDQRDPKYISLAQKTCSKAKELGADSPEVDAQLGELLLREGKNREAIAAFQRALTREPGDFEARNGLARAYEGSGQPKEAEATYRKAIELWPSYWEGYSNLAGFFFNRGRYRESAAMFQRVTELTPDSPMAFSNLGAIQELLGDFAGSVDSFQKSLALAPTDSAYANLGTVQFFLGQYSRSANSFEAAARLAPEHFQIWSNLGDARRWTPGLRASAQEAYERAIALCRKELQVNPQNALAHSTVALCLAKTGHLREADESSRKSLDLEGKNPEILYNAGIVSDLLGKREEAADRLRRALAAGYPRAFIEHEPEIANLRSSGMLKM
jgi:Flp pilus assembly protein TadD/TolB-like protein